MASNATNTGALALGLALVLGMGGCGNEPAGGQEEQTSGALTGELSVVSVLGSTDGKGQLYLLRPSDGSASVPLQFDTDPALASGTTLRVWGSAEGKGLRVSRYEVVPEGGAALIAAATPTSQTVAWVQINVNGGGVTQTAAAASALIFDQNAGPIFGTKSGNLSVVQYYQQASFGLLQLSGDVVGPVPFTGTACNNLDAVASAVVPEVTALGKTYNHYYLYWGAEQNCGPGWGAEGTHSKPQADVWLNMDGTFCTATGQELGHNFGLMHASTMTCPSSVTMANDTSTCTSNEYGNPMTVMGGGCRDFDAIEKWYSQWLSGCNGARINQSGTYTLFPIETACGGIQALQIPFSSGAPTRTTTTDQSNGPVTLNDYYLELRSSVGVDTGLKGGVYVYLASDIPAASKTGPRTFLLDMNPSTANSFDPMTAGQTFTDPAGGVSFTLNSFDATKASITVTVTGGSGNANTCIDGSTLSGSGPDSCGTSSTGTGGAGGTGGTGTGGTGAGTGGAGSGGHAGSTGTGGKGVGGATGGTGSGGAGSGSTGTGGTSGTGTGGAKGGTTGSTGAGGAGATGSGGSGAGTGGTGSGSTGTGGTSGAGTGGAKGGSTGGTSGANAGGASGTGAGGAKGATGGSGGGTGGDDSGQATSGCSCDLGAGSGQWPSRSGLALLLGMGAFVARPRRASRRATKRGAGAR